VIPAGGSKSEPRWGLWLAITVSMAGYLGLVRTDWVTGTLRASSVSNTIVWYLVAFAGFALVLWWVNHAETVTKLSSVSPSGSATRTTTGSTVESAARLAGRAMPGWRWLWLAPIVFRLLMLATEPTLSDDVYRYLWEGHLLTSGVNPYAYPVLDPALDIYATGHIGDLQSMVNNPTLASPYLPAAHGVFSLVHVILPTNPLSMQIVMTLLDGATALGLLALTRMASLPSSRVLIYWWNPLVIVETSHGAHLDALMVSLTVAAVVLTYRFKPMFDPSEASRAKLTPRPLKRCWWVAAPVAMALAVSTRPIPLLLVPVLFWYWGWRQRAMFGAAMAAMIAPFAFLPGWGAGRSVTESAATYSRYFRFNSGPYHWFERWVSSRGLDDKGWNEPVQLTRILVGLVVVVAMSWVFWRAWQLTKAFSASPSGPSLQTLLALLSVPMMVYVLATSVLHPWYLVMVIAFVIFLPSWFDRLPWLMLSALIVFSYLTYADPNHFAEREWVRKLEWFPTLSLLVLAAALALSRFLSARSPSPRRAGSVSTPS